MQTSRLYTPTVIKAILILQFLPIIIFPFSSYSPNSQEWWLPVLLVVFEVIAVVQVFRQNQENWPWDLMAFSQGFNIISRILLLMPHSILGKQFDPGYVAINLFSIVISVLLLGYFAKPEVRTIFLPQ